MAYFIWQEPMMLAANETYIHELMEYIGLENVAGNKGRYPMLKVEEIKALAPEYLFLSSEPFPFKIKHQIEYQRLFPDAKVVLVDGEMFSWYGSRMKLAADYFKQLPNDMTPNTKSQE